MGNAKDKKLDKIVLDLQKEISKRANWDGPRGAEVPRDYPGIVKGAQYAIERINETYGARYETDSLRLEHVYNKRRPIYQSSVK